MIFGTTSFRRILLTRLLLVSLPVLLLGVYVTYRKARSAFLETARQNLTESAVRKGQSIQQSIEALQTSLVTASDSVVLKFGNAREHQAFLEQLANTIPTYIRCVQLVDIINNRLRASTCNNPQIVGITAHLWPQQQKQLLTNLDAIHIKFLPPTEKNLQSQDAQLELSLAAPVYNSQGKLRYALSLQAALLEKEPLPRGSFAGYPVVINQKGTILSHPILTRVGRNIDKEADAKRLKIIMNSAIAGREDFLHLFAFDKDGVELVAGYSSIPSPVSEEKGQHWIVLAVSPLEAALAPLKDIRRVLFAMIFGLFAASLVATVYIAGELARPVEKLRDYVLNKENLNSKDQIPHNFRIREFSQLGIAIKEMLERLQAWSDEILAAWQEAENANKLKSEFLATTSHELRTPLNGIIGCLQIVREGYCDSRQEEVEFLQQADEAAIHLLEIINDILDLAKIEAGKLSVVLEPVNLSQILQESSKLQAAAIRKKGLQLHTPAWDDNIIIQADPTKLKQVLLNVIGNAVKFTESGGITIKMRLESDLTTKNSQKFAVITVQDTGIGIEPKQQEKLFRPFVMVDASTTRQFGGTGLGLAISRNLIQLMGGSISLSSRGRGLGTLVEIRLPLLPTWM
jgi:signal transduction histidine kinase